MSKQDFNFIELPTQDNMLSEEAQNMLLGGINCGVFQNGRCKSYSDGPCRGYGGCGGDFYCADYI